MRKPRPESDYRYVGILMSTRPLANESFRQMFLSIPGYPMPWCSIRLLAGQPHNSMAPRTLLPNDTSACDSDLDHIR